MLKLFVKFYCPCSPSQKVRIIYLSRVLTIPAPHAYSFNRYCVEHFACYLVRRAASNVCATLKVSNFHHASALEQTQSELAGGIAFSSFSILGVDAPRYMRGLAVALRRYLYANFSAIQLPTLIKGPISGKITPHAAQPKRTFRQRRAVQFNPLRAQHKSYILFTIWNRRPEHYYAESGF
jgi:hypothetical protein